MPDSITERERLFVLEYMKDPNVGEAYLRAGYKSKSKAQASKNGSSILRKPNVQAFLKQQREAVQERSNVTVDYVMRRLCLVYEKAMQDAPVYDSQGNVLRHVWNPQGALGALDKMGQRLGMWTNDKNVNVNKTVTHVHDPVVEKLPKEVLQEMMERIRERRKQRANAIDVQATVVTPLPIGLKESVPEEKTP